MTIGEKIRNRRKELKMSQTELAERTGYADKSGISKVENGLVELGQSGILKFAHALDLDYRYLLDWTDESGNELRNGYTDPAPQISDEDAALIEAYHNATPEQKRLVAYVLGVKLLEDISNGKG